MESTTVDRIDQFIALYRLVHAEEIAAARAEALSDEVVAAVLANCHDWRGAGELKAAVARAASTSEKTAQRRVLELVEQHVVSSKREGNNIFYKDAGLFG